MSIRGKTAIIGFSETPTLRDYGERSTTGLMAQVAREAIADAGLRKEDIDGIITSEGQTDSMIVGEALGFTPRYTASMTQHGAAPASGVLTAAAAVYAGLASNVLLLFGSNRPASFLRAQGAENPRGGDGPAAIVTEWKALWSAVVANAGYGLMKQRHMFEFGTKDEQFASWSVDERFNASKNLGHSGDKPQEGGRLSILRDYSYVDARDRTPPAGGRASEKGEQA